jgi:hypothetical protein
MERLYVGLAVHQSKGIPQSIRGFNDRPAVERDSGRQRDAGTHDETFKAKKRGGTNDRCHIRSKLFAWIFEPEREGSVEYTMNQVGGERQYRMSAQCFVYITSNATAQRVRSAAMIRTFKPVFVRNSSKARSSCSLTANSSK